MGTDLISNLDQSSLARMIVGRDVVTKMERGAQRPKHKVVEVKDLVYQNQEGRPVVNHLNFSIRAGEILGIAGVEGNGQSEVADLLCGMRPISHGNVCVNGTSINGLSVRKIRELGVSAISEDRLKFAGQYYVHLFEQQGLYKGNAAGHEKGQSVCGSVYSGL